MRIKLFCIALILFLGQETTCIAQLRLPSFFSDHMVLQRETPLSVWGWGNAGSTVKLIGTWFTDTVSTAVNGNGQWKLKLP